MTSLMTTQGAHKWAHVGEAVLVQPHALVVDPAAVLWLGRIFHEHLTAPLQSPSGRSGSAAKGCYSVSSSAYEAMEAPFRDALAGAMAKCAVLWSARVCRPLCPRKRRAKSGAKPGLSLHTRNSVSHKLTSDGQSGLHYQDTMVWHSTATQTDKLKSSSNILEPLGTTYAKYMSTSRSTNN